MSFDYDLFVIGAGSGGTRAARIASGYGAKVAIAESFRIGGTCVIRGCVPKKILVYASRFADAFADAPAFGWSTGEISFDWPTLVAAKETEITRDIGIFTRLGWNDGKTESFAFTSIDRLASAGVLHHVVPRSAARRLSAPAGRPSALG